MASLIAELTAGVVARSGVPLPWGRIAVDDDYGTFEIRAADPDDFLGWPTLCRSITHATSNPTSNNVLIPIE